MKYEALKGLHLAPAALALQLPPNSVRKVLDILNMSDVASIDSTSTASSDDYDEEYRIAQREWEESLEQLRTIFSIVLLPFFGKWLGRKWSYWGQFFDIFLMIFIFILHTLQLTTDTCPSAWGKHSWGYVKCIKMITTHLPLKYSFHSALCILYISLFNDSSILTPLCSISPTRFFATT